MYRESEICKYGFNPYRQKLPDWDGPEFSFLKNDDMLSFHRSIPGYRPTPLLSLSNLAKSSGLKEIYVKDESHRFGIKAFKALGASYAIYRFLEQCKQSGTFTFCAATDGNHGKAVAWTAKRLKQKAVIYMPENSARPRIDSVVEDGAEVVLVPGSFDDCVERCATDAKKNGWQAISDTAYPGYFEIPRYIMLGYTTIFRELDDRINKNSRPGIDFVFLPAGVGGLAAAGSSYFVRRYGENRPKLICVEPSDCDCFLESIRFGKGKPLPVKGEYKSIMVGLNCGIPSPAAWPIIRDSMDLFIAITDNYAVAAMREYHKENIISGESGASGLAGLLALLTDEKLKEAGEKIGLGRNSRVLLINTEGDTNPFSKR
ncbi:MAG: diaminopropionate ammonia-lyase [Candidatus Aminicenantes bacterium]|jgi:diaminopropionate ammonia-lyase|nr:diaminopropionate ammonia-lyase [Candidatus Aminicenantes bacterium]